MTLQLDCKRAKCLPPMVYPKGIETVLPIVEDYTKDLHSLKPLLSRKTSDKINI